MVKNKPSQNPVKNALSYALFYSGAFSLLVNILARLRKEHPCVVLVYHQIVDESSDYLDKGPVVHHHVSEFRKEVAYLKRHFDVLPMDEVVDRINSGKGFERPSVAITFDDGYLDNYTLAYPVLRKYNLPATIYLTTSLIGTKDRTWTDQIEYALLKTEKDTVAFEGLPDGKPVAIRTLEEKKAANTKIAEALKALPDEERKALMKRLFDKLKVDEGVIRNSRSRKMLNWDEVKEMAEYGITFGSHTHTHPILSKLPLGSAQQDILTSKRVIEEKIGREVRHFAFPNGRPQDFSPELEDYCRQIGFASVATVVYGTTDPGKGTPFALRRAGAMSPLWFFGKNISVLFLKHALGGRRSAFDVLAHHVRAGRE